jgi:regulation of enolase protein 1 (concanavalin A-like superfamily)
MEGKTVMPLLSLASASITLTASYDHEFDQAGLAKVLQAPASSRSKWIKLGVESLGGQPRLSVSRCDDWAD